MVQWREWESMSGNVERSNSNLSPLILRSLYRGEWHENQMQGCGVRISRQADGEFLIQEGQFVADNFLGTFMDCGLPEARHAAAEADVVAARAGRFKARGNCQVASLIHWVYADDR